MRLKLTKEQRNHVNNTIKEYNKKLILDHLNDNSDEWQSTDDIIKGIRLYMFKKKQVRIYRNKQYKGLETIRRLCTDLIDEKKINSVAIPIKKLNGYNWVTCYEIK